ncbi:hypothetical protein PV755_35885 [Streptomyces caniscabiei]|uniref:Uncharacterized protein n=1 Tax=Streptomyces caniscabiei TaxID=2746961 RepID=A0A927KY97_9ACTN|nr:hypothetical protein [Streptomyces caniscabiei]MBD9722305.1 hypothetical protein [Streptomyces caniscabiei]MDX3514229.1 hypothetical protein [Streptomyces caniscabiei]MDX3716745.1 hypothetical protein [Streptomyces caniscabiei]WEO22626.1 hypothetical protein IHE65_05440 [Streptomyces caniscabiei]
MVVDKNRYDVAVASDATAAYYGFLAPSLASMRALSATVAPWSELIASSETDTDTDTERASAW